MQSYLIIDLETTGLSAFEDRVVAIGTKANDEEIACDIDDNEKAMLERLMFKLNHSFPILVGYNINSFDIPFIQVRCLKYKINCKVLNELQRIDMMDIMYKLLNVRKRLGDCYAFIGFENNSFEHSGSSIPDLFFKKDFEKIRMHSIEDIKRSDMLFKALKESGLV